jgi:hypothetical protein
MNRLITIIITVLLVSGCGRVPTDDIQVEARSDRKAELSGYKTYGWLTEAAILNDAVGQWEPPDFDADAEIRSLINRELRKRGMFEEAIDPDIVVAFTAGVNLNMSEVNMDPNGDMQALNVPKGALLVQLKDGRSGYTIWMGVAKANVKKRPDTETAKARLDYVVTEMFKLLPQ